MEDVHLSLTQSQGTPMKEFVEYIVKNLVDNPDKVQITEVGGTHTLIIELKVEKADIGKIIGKKGKTINAIRTLLMSVASRNGLRVNLEIVEEGEPTPTESSESIES
jgi:predicted RNA-binding protein YlqC (UPF0109 family)